jgi:hypothetical protein
MRYVVRVLRRRRVERGRLDPMPLTDNTTGRIVMQKHDFRRNEQPWSPAGSLSVDVAADPSADQHAPPSTLLN